MKRNMQGFRQLSASAGVAAFLALGVALVGQKLLEQHGAAAVKPAFSDWACHSRIVA